MSRTDSDSHSVCSSRPSVSNGSKVKKRGFRRFSVRQLFYASPLLGPSRKPSSKKSKSAVESDGRSDSGSSSEQTSAEHDVVAATASSNAAENKGRSVSIACNPPSVITLPRSSTNELYTSATLLSSNSESDSASSQTLLKPELNKMSMSSETDEDYVQILECPLCLSEKPSTSFPVLNTCCHRSCRECLQHYLKIEINESRVNIFCPECIEPLHPTDIRNILDDEITMNKYEEYTLRRLLAKDPDTRWCPAPDCSYAVVATGCASCPRLQCERPGCQMFFCYHCKHEWHPNQTCDAARAQRSPNLRASSISFGQDSSQRDDIKPCPRCQVLIVKMDDGSCNHMTCAVCGAEFCWLCMKEISDLHYLSPSGCTFWGKKPWSRKKKILWQLGTLVGAPVGIGLVAGIAVPAIIIGVPVWVGRKLHARYRLERNKHKRNLAVTGGVAASILVSPILAGLAVGIGVPILLAYIYGVVPISLCRSGGCGVTTSAAGVRIEFDDESNVNIGNTDKLQDGHSMDAGSHRVGNPSIGEVSFAMSASLSMGSGSHLDRMGVIRDGDHECSSNTAIAGTSLTGSVYSGMIGQRLEVQADVASSKHYSYSSETASTTASLSERSTVASLNDDVTGSTRALAGSIISSSRVSSSNFTPAEVHVDARSLAVECSQESMIDRCRGQDNLSEESGSIKVGVHGRNRKGTVERQARAILESESSSIWSREDTGSERVRFDDNVSFIDDLHNDEAQYVYCHNLSDFLDSKEGKKHESGTCDAAQSSTHTKNGANCTCVTLQKHDQHNTQPSASNISSIVTDTCIIAVDDEPKFSPQVVQSGDQVRDKINAEPYQLETVVCEQPFFDAVDKS
ncbi:hypothetical protein CHUAL_008656 [Chamberlinius hualienensis]